MKIMRIIFILLILTACSVQSTSNVVAETHPQEQTWFEHSIMDTVTPNVMNRYVDIDAGIVCYVVTTRFEPFSNPHVLGGTAMQCFLITETRLDK